MSVIDNVTEPLVSKSESPRSLGDPTASLLECFGNYSMLKLTNSLLKGFLFGAGRAFRSFSWVSKTISKHLDRLGVSVVFGKGLRPHVGIVSGPSSNDFYQLLLTLSSSVITQFFRFYRLEI